MWLGSESWSGERSDEQEAEEQTWCGLGVIKLHGVGIVYLHFRF